MREKAKEIFCRSGAATVSIKYSGDFYYHRSIHAFYFLFYILSSSYYRKYDFNFLEEEMNKSGSFRFIVIGC